MYREISKLIIYTDANKDNILSSLGSIFYRFDKKLLSPEDARSEIYAQVRRLLDVATRYGFDNDLWHNYLTYLMITDENPFSLTYEKAGKQEGTVNTFAINDFCVFKNLTNDGFFHAKRFHFFGYHNQYPFPIIKSKRMVNSVNHVYCDGYYTAFLPKSQYFFVYFLSDFEFFE